MTLLSEKPWGGTMKTWQYSLAVALCLSAASTLAHGQSYPHKPVTLVATAAAGGVVDLLARQVGARLSQMWGQQVIVENRAGA